MQQQDLFAAPPRRFLDRHQLAVQVDDRDVHVGQRISMFLGERLFDGTPLRWVHVISPHVGGEIRGYALIDGQLRVRLPAYSGLSWPELDHAVADLLGAELRGDDGGGR